MASGDAEIKLTGNVVSGWKPNKTVSIVLDTLSEEDFTKLLFSNKVTLILSD